LPEARDRLPVARENLLRVDEDFVGQIVPEVIDTRQFIDRDELPSQGFNGYSDFDEFGNLGDEHIDPSNLVPLADPIAAEVLHVGQEGSRLFLSFADRCLTRGFVRLDSAARNTPASILDVAEKDEIASPWKD